MRGLFQSLQRVFTYSGFHDNVLKNYPCIIAIGNFK